eukprot:365663-Chlamydomonas_euryale.AAC.26
MLSCEHMRAHAHARVHTQAPGEPVRCAVSHGHEECVRLLMAFGAKPVEPGPKRDVACAEEAFTVRGSLKPACLYLDERGGPVNGHADPWGGHVGPLSWHTSCLNE